MRTCSHHMRRRRRGRGRNIGKSSNICQYIAMESSLFSGGLSPRKGRSGTRPHVLSSCISGFIVSGGYAWSVVNNDSTLIRFLEDRTQGGAHSFGGTQRGICSSPLFRDSIAQRGSGVSPMCHGGLFNESATATRKASGTPSTQ